jgi:hypothetical protein
MKRKHQVRVPTLYITGLHYLNSPPGKLGREIVSKTHFGGFGDEKEEEEEEEEGVSFDLPNILL